MDTSDVSVLFDHLYWVRDRILEAADGPSVAFVDPAPTTVRDLRATLVHELDTEWSWRERLRADDRTAFPPDGIELAPADFPTLESVRVRWARDEAEMREWLGGISDADLQAACRAERGGHHPFWYHLQHIYVHGIQQFTEAAAILTQAARSPGELGFVELLRERDAEV